MSLSINQMVTAAGSLPLSPRMPVLFVGHGSPMNAVEDNAFTRRLRTIGAQLPKPVALLVVSAHWFTAKSEVSVHPHPPTIYDFGPFDDRLFHIKYPAPGAPDLAQAVVAETAAHFRLEANENWGLDHGAWTILKYLYPEANIPTFQLSLNYRMTPAEHYALGQALRFVRDRGVLVIGSGNIVHNLRRVNWEHRNAGPFDWAEAFDARIAGLINSGDLDALQQPVSTSEMNLAHPTPDHYWPLIYSAGLVYPQEAPTTLFEGYEHGSISMRTVGWGL